MTRMPVEKVRFTRRDVVPLHELPSAKAHDPIIVQAHPGTRPLARLRRPLRIGAVLALLLVLVGALLFALVEQGLADRFIVDRARLALARAAGENFRTELGGAALRFADDGRLALEARDVSLARVDGQGANHVEKVRLVLAPAALLTGRLEVASVEFSGIALAVGQGDGFRFADLSRMRIDTVDEILENGFVALNRAASALSGFQTEAIRLADVTLSGGEGALPLRIVEAVMAGGPAGLTVEAEMEAAGRGFGLSAAASGMPGEGGLSRIEGAVRGLSVDFRTGRIEERHFGADTRVDLAFRAERAGPEADPVLELKLSAAPGTVTFGGISSDLRELELDLAYEAPAQKIEIRPSVVRIGASALPFSGGLIDIDRLSGAEGKGIAFDLVITDGLAAPGDSEDVPVRFGAKAFGRFLPGENRVVADRLAVAAGREAMVASASLELVEGKSPAINLYAASDRMATTAVKQLWPYWLGKKARQWALNNLYGGRVLDGRIQLSIPAGHFVTGREADPLTAEQFRIDFDFERARLNVAGEIPPLRDTTGHFSLRGPTVNVRVRSATAYFPTGRTVDVGDGVFAIARTDEKPLMADLDLSVTGAADAVAELITYHPIDALEKIGLKPEDLSGKVASRVQARFGLVREQDPPAPRWTVDLALDGVDIAPPVEGRRLAGLEGTLKVTERRAELEAEADVDGVPLKLSIVRPVGGSDVKAERRVTGILDDRSREKLAPGSGLVVSGPVGLTLEQKAGTNARVALDLKAATLTVPGVGWSKGKGIAAKGSFEIVGEGRQQELKDFRVSGEGFAVAGAISIRDGAFSGARFERMQLSPGDDYRVDIARGGKGYRIEVSGRSADLRPLIASGKKSVAAPERDTAGDPQIEVSGSLDEVRGFQDEVFSAARFRYAGKGSAVGTLDFRAVSRNGQAVVLAHSGNRNGESIEIASGDAGAFARFAGIYGKIQGGLLNIRLSRQGDQPRRGVVDIRNFTIVGEEKLRALVSSPADPSGRSLSDAVRRDIDVNRAEFELAHARVEAGNGYLRVGEGVLRGPEIGASFQGDVYNRAGNIDMTGTFMPAYGINRLFGELPLIGAILGNGRDRGLIGITFRLVGKASAPRVEVNPLSVIAPGVFRSIFEYR